MKKLIFEKIHLMKKLLPVIIILAIVLAVLNFTPKTLHNVKSAVIEGNKDLIYKTVTDFKSFVLWSPWAELDPDMKMEFIGEMQKPGAIYKWDSDSNDVGHGTMEILSMTPDTVKIKLNFTSPWESESEVFFAFEDDEKGTKVTWGFHQDATLMIGFFGIEEKVGASYEKGLKNLQNVMDQMKNVVPKIEQLEEGVEEAQV